MSTATAPAVHDAARGGKYLTFYLGDEEYGVAILRVQEIISMQPITRVPRTPAFMRGVINLRGRVIPIVDLRERFGMPPANESAAGDPQMAATAAAVRCIVIVEVKVRDGGGHGAAACRVPMGVVVDRVSEVATIDTSAVEDPPSFGAGVRTEFLLGVAVGRGGEERGGQGKGADAPRTAGDGGRVRLLLDIDRVLADEEIAELTSAVA